MEAKFKPVAYKLAYRNYRYNKACEKRDKAKRQLNKAEDNYSRIVGEAIKQAIDNANIAHKQARKAGN
jgi:hypothetical protein